MNPTDSADTAKVSARRICANDLVLASMVAAILSILSQISLPTPMGVPITIQVFGIALVGIVFGWRLGLMGTLAYILLGAAGLPIFANFHGGIPYLINYTGGYILSWPLMAVLCGLHVKTASKRMNVFLLFLFSLTGLGINEFLGGLQWSLLAGDMTGRGIFIYSMTAFVPKDAFLTILAVIFGSQMRRLFLRVGFLAK